MFVIVIYLVLYVSIAVVGQHRIRCPTKNFFFPKMHYLHEIQSKRLGGKVNFHGPLCVSVRAPSNLHLSVARLTERCSSKSLGF